MDYEKLAALLDRDIYRDALAAMRWARRDSDGYCEATIGDAWQWWSSWFGSYGIPNTDDLAE